MWRFLVSLLRNPYYNPGYIRWVDKGQGIFMFVQTKEVARLWGKKKRKENMTYENMTRAIR